MTHSRIAVALLVSRSRDLSLKRLSDLPFRERAGDDWMPEPAATGGIRGDTAVARRPDFHIDPGQGNEPARQQNQNVGTRGGNDYGDRRNLQS